MDSSGNFVFNKSYADAEKEAINLGFNFYSNETNNQGIYDKYKIVYLIALKIIEIKFSSSRSHQNKTLDLVRYMMNDAYIADRELKIAVDYFNKANDKDQNKGKVFKKIYKNMNQEKFNERVKNIVWDIVAPRIMEEYIKGESSVNKLFVPFFVSYDGNLRETISANLMKTVFIHKDSNVIRILSIPSESNHDFLLKNHCQKAVEELEAYHSRGGKSSNFKKINVDEAIKKLEVSAFNAVTKQ